ncbi:MAG: hypothetical protein H7095_09675 [Pseudopedobacter sp.]|nr:hypothetical protein [Deinococcales bacterium]
MGQLIHNPSFEAETLRALESLTLLPERLPPEVRTNLWAQMADLDSNALERTRCSRGLDY